MAFGNLANSVHITGEALNVYGHNCLGVGCDLSFEIVGVEGQRVVDLCDYGNGTRLNDRHRGSDIGVCRDNDLVTGTDTEGNQGSCEGGVTACHNNAVRDAKLFAKLIFCVH